MRCVRRGGRLRNGKHDLDSSCCFNAFLSDNHQESTADWLERLPDEWRVGFLINTQVEDAAAVPITLIQNWNPNAR